MSTANPREHVFRCHLVWAGAPEAGAAADVGGAASLDAYSRAVRIEIEGKPSLAMSAAPAFKGDPAAHNPEDLLVASLSACHCLSYLALCAMAGVRVVAYEDEAVGTLQRVDRVMRFTEVVLRPRVTVAAGADVGKARALHEKAHASCFIASSVNFPVRNEPTLIEA